MSTSLGPTPEQIDALKLRQIINDIDQKRADSLRKEQERRFVPLKIVIAGLTAGAALMAAGIALRAFLLPHR